MGFPQALEVFFYWKPKIVVQKIPAPSARLENGRPKYKLPPMRHLACSAKCKVWEVLHWGVGRRAFRLHTYHARRHAPVPAAMYPVNHAILFLTPSLACRRPQFYWTPSKPEETAQACHESYQHWMSDPPSCGICRAFGAPRGVRVDHRRLLGQPDRGAAAPSGARLVRASEDW